MDDLSENTTNGFLESLKSGQISTALFQALPDVIFWIKDKEGRIVYANRAFCHGVSVKESGELLGLRDEDLYPKELAEVFQKDDEDVLRTGVAIWNKTELLPNRLGLIEWRSTSKIPLQNLSGKWIGTAGISRKMGQGGVGGSSEQTIVSIVETVYNNLDQITSISRLAQAAAISMSTLERLFKKHMNTTPRKFILQVKMSAACDHLMNTQMQVKEIAASLGYEEHANFTRAFTNEIGMSPRAYKKYYSLS